MIVRIGFRPAAFKNPMALPSNVESWSSSMKRCGPSPGNTSRSCCTTQTGVGSRVTLKCRILRRWCSMTKKHESSWKVNVGTVKKIAGDDRLAVVGEEGRPAAGGIAAAWHAPQKPGDAAFGNVEAELQEFPVDPGCPPVRILRRQATDQ